MSDARSESPGGPSLGAVMGERRQLINLAYRLLGSLTEAEDVVQETYARWYAMSPRDQQAVDSPGAWLNTVASRICLNLLGSARMRREQYVGEWIPEPLPSATVGWPDATADPADKVTLDESVNMAFLIVLDSMTPAERVAFILHDVFRYSFVEIGEIVGRTAAACRQLASSARRRVRAARDAPEPTGQQAEVVRSFRRAWEAHDMQAIIRLLDPDAVATADGGGMAVTFLDPIVGREQIAAAWIELANRRHTGQTLHERMVNGQPGLVAEEDGVAVTVFAFDLADGLIRRIWVIRNPEKLRAWTRRWA